MKRIFFLAATIWLSVFSVHADEGMWLPSQIGEKIEQMRARGFELDAEDIYSESGVSLKDAVVQFGKGCTGEVVSAQGLILTNHHCGFPQIQHHSSVEHDYLTYGYWARSLEEELPNPGLTVTFLVRMEDVTDRVLTGTSDLEGDMKQSMINVNIETVIKEAVEGTHYKGEVRSMYYGNQYYLFVNEVFRDVRLVAAPPTSIGSFGGDIDNWMWPRHTGDFSVFRIYADKDNKPADYSKDNVPYTPKNYFRVAANSRVGEGDFTMVYGFPANTRQYLHSAGVEYILERENPMKIDLRTQRLDVIKAAQSTDPAIRIAYADKASLISNSWKRWQGESLGLARLQTVQKKKEFEERLDRWTSAFPEYEGIVGRLQEQYDRLEKYAFARMLYVESVNTIELFQAVAILIDSRALSLSEDNFPERLKLFYKNYSAGIDSEIAKIVLCEYIARSDSEFLPHGLLEQIEQAGGVDNFVDWLFESSAFTSMEKLMDTFTGDDIFQQILEDPAVYVIRECQLVLADINSGYSELDDGLYDLYTTFMKAMMEYENEESFFPDANSTLRVSYGVIEGYQPEDAIWCRPFSTMRGIIEKDDPNTYDYNVPDALRQFYNERDSNGVPYADHTVCFIASNHTTGGNSGSPVLNSKGELIGINFDRTWLSTMSDIEFDPYICRNICVDIRYVLFVIKNVGRADRLIDEMTII